MEDGAFCYRFFRGSILPVGEHCEPTGKIEPRKNRKQNPHPPCVSIASIWGKNMLGYLSLDMICSSKLTVFIKLCSRKTVRFSEQMSVDKYPGKLSSEKHNVHGQTSYNIFMSNEGYSVYLEIFFAICTVLKIGEYYLYISHF